MQALASISQTVFQLHSPAGWSPNFFLPKPSVNSALFPYCIPDEPCFPDSPALEALNRTISGRLERIKPVEEVCYAGPRYSESACLALRASYSDPAYRSSTPATLQYTNWQLLPTGVGCPLPTNGTVGPENVCKQGSVPAYVVHAKSANDVQQAVRFASRHRLRLRIRNTGHDYLGRSSDPGSFTIVTNALASTNYLPRFSPVCSPWRPIKASLASGPAVCVGSGVTNLALYGFAERAGVGVVGGASSSVGVAGGVTLGGGHGPLGPLWGMASDNVLQIELVTADGKLRNASACKNADLFWALRGGGGGTFGVTTRVWYRAHPKLRGVAGVFGTWSASTGESYRALTRRFMEMLTGLEAAGITGYAEGLNTETHVAFMQPSMRISPRGDDMLKAFAPLYELAAQDPNISIKLTTAESESWYDFYKGPLHLAFGDLDAVGINLLLGSRLVPRATVENATSRDQLADTLSSLHSPFILHLVAGGAVSRFPEDATALNPAWRTAFLHIDLPVTWPSAAPAQYRAAADRIRSYVTNITLQLSAAAYPPQVLALQGVRPASYINEADIDEKDWTDVFWGKHYPKLLAIKKKWDPKGTFSCRKCVGSEVNGF